MPPIPILVNNFYRSTNLMAYSRSQRMGSQIPSKIEIFVQQSRVNLTTLSYREVYMRQEAHQIFVPLGT
jgi:hypothetical protein